MFVPEHLVHVFTLGLLLTMLGMLTFLFLFGEAIEKVADKISRKHMVAVVILAVIILEIWLATSPETFPIKW